MKHLLLAVLALGSTGLAASGQAHIRGWGSQVFDSDWSDDTDYVAVVAGGHHTLARRSNGSLVAWGYDNYGECHVPALPPGISYVEVATSAKHTVALRSDGSVVAWGWNYYGQTNVPALPPGLAYVEVAAGEYHTVARRNDGSVVAWGSNSSGQLNVPALPPGLAYVEIAAGEYHAVARRSDGSVVAWGFNGYGQLNVPALPPGLSYVEVAAGLGHTVARRSDGSVVVWGNIGYGVTSVPPLPPGLTYVEIAAGQLHTVARRSDGSVVAWGDDRYGQIDVPALPPTFAYIEIAAGGTHSVARYEALCATLEICEPAAPAVSDGCLPDVSWVGTPDVAQIDNVGPSDFVVTFSSLSEHRACIPVIGKGAPISLAWSTESSRCFPNPFSRTLLRNTGDANGASACGGSVSLDVEAFLQSGNPALTPATAGDDYVVQAWYRDPASTKKTQMTDALHFTVCP
jgi:hypothetical protein